MSEYSIAYYEDIRGRLQAIVSEVARNLRPETYTFLIEMLESNELGVSLEVLVEALEEADLPISSGVLEGLSRLSEVMEMAYDVRGPLSNLVRA